MRDGMATERQRRAGSIREEMAEREQGATRSNCARRRRAGRLWELSRPRIEDNAQHTEEIIDRLFPGNPLLCCGKSSQEFDTRPRDDWRGEMSALALIVPSPMSAVTGMTKDGKESKHTLANTGRAAVSDLRI